MARRKLIVEVLGDSRSLSRTLRRSEHDVASFGATVQRSTRRVGLAFAAAGAAVVGAGIKTSQVFGGFEKSMSKIEGLVGASEQQVDRWSKAILKLGPETGKSVRELGEAMYYVTSAGLEGQRAMEALEMSAKASASGLGDTQTIADAVTSAMNAYAKSGLTAADATDILTAAVVEGKLEAEALAPVLGSMLPTASALGISFDKVAGTLAVLSKTGVDAAEGATQVNALMMAMLSTSPKVTKALKSVGLSQRELRAVAGGPRGLVGVMRLLQGAFRGNVEAMRQVFPNVRAFRPVMNALAQDSADVDKVLRNVTDSTGALARAFDKASKDEAFKWDQARASVEAAFVRIGAMAAPAVKTLAESLNWGVGRFNAFLDRLSAARTISGKLSVIWEGADGARKAAQSLLAGAVARIDWGRVWARAQDIGVGLQERIMAIDWVGIGSTIGNNMADAVERALSNTKRFVTRLMEVVRDIPWTDLGKEMGPGLAGALVSAFLTLMDPTWWARNWELALGVALVALGGPLGRLAGKLAVPFVKLGGDLMVMLGLGIGKAVPRLGWPIVRFFESTLPKALRYAFRKVGRVFDALFGGLANRITDWLERHGVIRFVVKVFGVVAALRVVGDLIDSMKSLWSRFARWLERQALLWALRVYEPFSHLPRWMGQWARDAKERIQAQLDELPESARLAAEGIQAELNRTPLVVPVVIGKPDEGTRPGVSAPDTGGRPDEGTRGARPGDKPKEKPGATESEEERRLRLERERIAEERRALEKERAALAAARKENARQEAANKKRRNLEEEAGRAAADAAEAAKQAWQQARDSAGAAFGTLFSGPILGSITSAIGDLAVELDPRLILQDIQAQNKRAVDIFADLDKIERRGGPDALLETLRGMGVAGGSVAASIADAPGKVFNAIVRAFQRREQLQRREAVHIRADKVLISAASVAQAFMRRAGGGSVPGAGVRDSVPALLTPGELVLNRRQQRGLAGALGLSHGTDPDRLFGHIQRFADGGPVTRTSNQAGARIGAGAREGSGLLRRVWEWLDPGALKSPRTWWGAFKQDVQLGKQMLDPRPAARDIDRWTRDPLDARKAAWAALGIASWAPLPGGALSKFVTREAALRAGAGVLAPTVVLPAGLRGPRLTREQQAELLDGFRMAGRSLLLKQANELGVVAPGFRLGADELEYVAPKLSRGTRALDRLKKKLFRQSDYGSKWPLQEANLRLVREPPPERLTRDITAERMTLGGRRVGELGVRAFDRAAARDAADRIFKELRARETKSLKLAHMLPENVRTPDDLVVLMEDLFNSARAGAVGRFWYEKSGAEILQYAGGDKAVAHKLAKMAALYSPQVSVEESINRAAKAWAEFQDTGRVTDAGGAMSPEQVEKAMRIMRGEPVSLWSSTGGRKMQNFYVDLMRVVDPDWVKKQTGAGGRFGLTERSATMDVWMQKAFGYRPKWTVKKGKGAWKIPAPSKSQYDFMELVNKQVGDQLGWTPHQTQAGVWTTTKGRWEGRPLSEAASDIGDYMGRQSTSLNWEAAWGQLGARIRRELGQDAAWQYLRQKRPLVEPVLGKLGMLGRTAEEHQGVWGIDVSPGAGTVVLAPRYKESARRWRMMPRQAMQTREAAAAIGYILKQEGVGTLTPFPTRTSAGTINTNVKAGHNALWLARKLDDEQLAKVSSALGTSMLMIAHQGGWVIKPARNAVKADDVLKTVRARLQRAREAGDLTGFRPVFEPINAKSGMVWESEYDTLLRRADRKHPGFLQWVRQQRAASDAIDAQWKARLQKQIGKAGGGVARGAGSRDTVPALLTPGELVLNRGQQRGLARVLGVSGASPERLFDTVSSFQGGGVVVSGNRTRAQSFLPPAAPTRGTGTTFEQHNTITVPPHFADTQWAVERGLEAAAWRLRKGI